MQRMRPVLFLAVAMGWCSWARASEPRITSTHCEEELSNKELVLCGIAAPDDVLFRVPMGINEEPFFNRIWKHFGGDDDSVRAQDRRPWTQISPGLWAFHLPSEGLTLTQKAERVDEALLLLDKAKGIRMGPPIVIPELLKKLGIVSEDIRIRPEALSQSSPTIASVKSSLLDWTTSNAEPNLYMVALATPAPLDPGYKQQCGLKAINAEEAWKTITDPDASDVKIAIVDSGVDETHPDLVGNAATASTYDVDLNGHGTHLAGIIGGVKDDTTGIVGVAWKTNIKAYRFLDASGRGMLKDAIPKIEEAISGNSRIILLAWGVAKGSPELNAVLLKARAKKILLVTAAGNSGQDTETHPIYPASYPLDNLISVMATTCDDVRPRFSNFGRRTVDLAAPGEGLSNELRIYSSVLHHQWGHLAGTSMAAAFVAGAAALIFEKNPTATPQQVKCWLNLSVDQIPGLENKSGGRLNLAKAVKPLDTAKCP